MGDAIATREGFTRQVMAWGDGDTETLLLIKPNTKFDDTFKAWDSDLQEFVMFNPYGKKIRDLPKIPPLSDKRMFPVQFANECKNLGIEPLDYAQLMYLANRAANAWVRENNNGATPPLKKATIKARHNFEAAARLIGWKTRWDSFHPTIEKDGKQRPVLTQP